EYDELPAVIDPEAALLPDAPLQFEELGTNRAAGTRPRPADDPLAGAEVVVRGRFENQRIAVLPMEGNAIAVVPGSESDDYDVTVYVSTQMPHGTATRASSAFELPSERVRVVAPNVGGAFGGKPGLAPEHVVVIAAARRLQRPAKWIETRSENLVAMPHGPGQVQSVELACTRERPTTGR